MNLEKEEIYFLMKQIIAERRELSKQYYELKKRLEKIDLSNTHLDNTLIKENFSKKNKTENHMPIHDNSFEYPKKVYVPIDKKKVVYPFERISGYIIELLKQSPIPLGNKVLYKQLQNKYDIHISYTNFTNNILRKIHDSPNIPVEKAYRGYWQYRKKGEM